MATTLFDPTLQMNADSLDDIERTRIANENRLRTLTLPIEDHGAGLDPTDPDVARLQSIVDALKTIEHTAVLNLGRTMRNHPLGAWAKAQKGIGDKTMARLLASIGDPYMRDIYTEDTDGNMTVTGTTPRTVSQLWAYCGHGNAALKKRKGMTQADALALGNPTAKKRLYLISEACLKAQGHYADVYYARKEANQGRVHAEACVRCGPSGHPAPAGSPWKDSHRHADALRIVGKEILKDLWVAARAIHEAGGAQTTKAVA
ncbi:hypothetical protein SCMU_14610 [Sinomonas cyclohexanicum]|uniref:Uncharacterized protein n=1 Tax=Sinomonas cyclohexanicum TaxID=322009 RepID=A0ABN6FG35_SINCY|nr:hypothetical protein [Corynebacterium cyclohexanicum]BCT75619.1 hypothetical protein SCMU_14610 [Corynebacterium cyclohexanicum]